jgi:hypothetical protein
MMRRCCDGKPQPSVGTDFFGWDISLYLARTRAEAPPIVALPCHLACLNPPVGGSHRVRNERMQMASGFLIRVRSISHCESRSETKKIHIAWQDKMDS